MRIEEWFERVPFSFFSGGGGRENFSPALNDFFVLSDV
jgi:hypothetical protein